MAMENAAKELADALTALALTRAGRAQIAMTDRAVSATGAATSTVESTIAAARRQLTDGLTMLSDAAQRASGKINSA